MPTIETRLAIGDMAVLIKRSFRKGPCKTCGQLVDEVSAVEPGFIGKIESIHIHASGIYYDFCNTSNVPEDSITTDYNHLEWFKFKNKMLAKASIIKHSLAQVPEFSIGTAVYHRKKRVHGIISKVNFEPTTTSYDVFVKDSIMYRYVPGDSLEPSITTKFGSGDAVTVSGSGDRGTISCVNIVCGIVSYDVVTDFGHHYIAIPESTIKARVISQPLNIKFNMGDRVVVILEEFQHGKCKTCGQGIRELLGLEPTGVLRVTGIHIDPKRITYDLSNKTSQVMMGQKESRIILFAESDKYFAKANAGLAKKSIIKK